MSDDGEAGLRERLRLAAVPIPTWTAEIAYAVRLDDVLAVVAAWLREEADRWAEQAIGVKDVSILAGTGWAKANAICALADTLDPKETDR